MAKKLNRKDHAGEDTGVKVVQVIAGAIATGAAVVKNKDKIAKYAKTAVNIGADVIKTLKP